MSQPETHNPWEQRGTDLGAECPARGKFLRAELCEIGCTASRGLLPIYECQQFTECCPWRWQREQTMRSCLDCMADGAEKLANSPCTGC